LEVFRLVFDDFRIFEAWVISLKILVKITSGALTTATTILPIKINRLFVAN